MALTVLKRVRSPIHPGGDFVHYQGSDPAAGAAWSETVPANKTWLVLGVRSTLTTDATVVNRVDRVVVDDGTNTLLIAKAISVAGASVTARLIRWASYGTQYTTSGNIEVNVWPRNVVIGEGYRVRSSAINFQAGDDYGAPWLYVIEWSV